MCYSLAIDYGQSMAIMESGVTHPGRFAYHHSRQQSGIIEEVFGFFEYPEGKKAGRCFRQVYLAVDNVCQDCTVYSKDKV